MRKLVLAGLVAGLGGLGIPVAHANDAGSAALSVGTLAQAGAAHVVRSAGPAMRPSVAPQRSAAWGRRVNGRWSAGANAPGGWNSYYRPVAGWSLPSYWINPSYYIADWRAYGLPAPAAGYGWSRYYDDAVLTDRYGRVADARYGYDWDRYGGYEDAYDAPPPLLYDGGAPYETARRDTGNAVAGAVVGGVVGGVAGNVIAGRGNRTAGTVIGAGVGAVAGAAIGASSGKAKRPRANRATEYGSRYDAPPPRGYAPASYDGRWTGTWEGRDGAVYDGSYEGRFDGDVRGAYSEGASFARPAPYAVVPAYGYNYGYAAGGYSYAAEYVAPTVVTTTVTTEETTYVAKRAAARKVVRKPAPRRRVVCCPCGC